MMSMTVLVLVCIWHAIVPQIAADWGLPLAHITDMIVLVILGLVFVAIHVVFVLWIRKRVRRTWSQITTGHESSQTFWEWRTLMQIVPQILEKYYRSEFTKARHFKRKIHFFLGRA